MNTLSRRLLDLAATIAVIKTDEYGDDATELFDGQSDPADLKRAAKIVETVERFARLSGEVREKRRQRASFACDRAEGPDAEAMEAIGGFTAEQIAAARATMPQPKPCWKLYEWPSDDPGDTDGLTPQSEWCESCQGRQDAHVSLRVAVKLRGAAMRSLQKLAGAR